MPPRGDSEIAFLSVLGRDASPLSLSPQRHSINRAPPVFCLIGPPGPEIRVQFDRQRLNETSTTTVGRMPWLLEHALGQASSANHLHKARGKAWESLGIPGNPCMAHPKTDTSRRLFPLLQHFVNPPKCRCCRPPSLLPPSLRAPCRPHRRSLPRLAPTPSVVCRQMPSLRVL